MLDFQKSLNDAMEKKEVKSGILYSIFICAFIVVSTLIGLIYSLLDKKVDDSFIPSLIGYALSTIITLALYKKTNKREEDAKIFNKFNPLYLILSVVLSVGMLLGFGFTNTLFANFLEKLGLNASSSVFDLSTFPKYLFAVLCLAVAPAFFEEIVFRHVLLNGIKGKMILGSLLCAFCFALYHLSLSQFVYQFIYGFFLSVLAIKSKSIIPSIVAHFLNNFIILTLDYLSLSINLLSPIVIVVGLILIATFVFITLIYKREKSEEALSLSKFLMASGVGIIISIILVVGVCFG